MEIEKTETEQAAKITIAYPELVREIEEIFDGELKESETVEFKKSVSEIENAIKTICAFLNNNGGSIYFGVTNDGTVKGINISDANIREISKNNAQDKTRSNSENFNS